MNSLLEAALQYAQRGWYVFPLVQGKKVPLARLAPHGVKNASIVESIIKEWWEAEPSANIGIAAGVSKLVVFDVDVKEGRNGEAVWQRLLAEARIRQPATWVVNTPSGGRHIYFTSAEALAPSEGKWGKGLDVRAGESYVVAPPSTTSDGIYKPNNRLAFTNIAKLPAALLAKFQQQPLPATTTVVSAINEKDLPAEVERAREALSKLAVTRADGYQQWIEVGMSLRELGEAGLTLFNEFSQQSDRYNKPDSAGRSGYAMVEQAWYGLQTTTTNKPITLGSLYHWAEEDCTSNGAVEKTVTGVKGSFTTTSGISINTFADLEKEYSNITWAWDGWLPNGFLTMLAGSQGIGKSILLLQLAGCFTDGWDWPDGTPFTGKRGKVLWVEGECSEGLNIERARNWGMDLSQIVLCSEGGDDTAFSIANQQHIHLLNEVVSMEEVVFLIVDSLSGVHSTAENKEDMLETMRLFVTPLKRTGKPGVISHHLRKPSQGGANVITLDDVRGSGTISQLARSVIGLDAPDAEHQDWKRLSSLKLNIKKAPNSIGLEHTEAYGRFRLTNKAPTYNKINTFKHTQLDSAIELLENELAEGGQVPYEDLMQLATENNISEATLRRADKELKLKHATKNKVTYWYLE